MKNNESMEMYLETILLLSSQKPAVHAIDVAERLGYSRASVSRAAALLHERGYIIVNGESEISLTPRGRARAEGVYERHCVLTKLLEFTGASRAIAEENACRIEHVISDEMFDVIKDFVAGL